MTRVPDATRGSRVATIASWLLQIVLALFFVYAGGSKLLGATAMVQLFDAVGIGQWLRYVTGAFEITGAVLLLVPTLAGLGALLLIAVMMGAIVSHLTVLHNSPVAPLVLLIGLAFVAYVRRAEITAQIGRLRR